MKRLSILNLTDRLIRKTFKLLLKNSNKGFLTEKERAAFEMFRYKLSQAKKELIDNLY
jgi:hypothetical protein